jgi:hypothetical protein
MWDNIQRPTETFSDGREITFRSTWEANYAFYLEWLKEQGEIKEWEYEPERYDFIGYENGKPFVVGPGYLPDFRVTRNDGTQYLVEIKGVRQGIRKVQRMKKYYPHLPVELVDSKEYAVLKKKLGKTLNFY